MSYKNLCFSYIFISYFENSDKNSFSHIFLFNILKNPVKMHAFQLIILKNPIKLHICIPIFLKNTVEENVEMVNQIFEKKSGKVMFIFGF